MAVEDEILTGEEAANLLKVSRITLWRLRKQHGLPSFKVGRELRFFKHELLQWIQEERAREAQLDLALNKKSIRKSPKR